MTPLIPDSLLNRQGKILFITHLAIGDFAYLSQFFKAFSLQFPHLEIHVWADEVRRTRCFWRWNSLRNYSLYQWLSHCSYIKKVYDKTYSPGVFKKSIKMAQQEKYDIVVSLATLRQDFYATLARTISPRGFVAGMASKQPFYRFFKRYALYKLSARLEPLPSVQNHVTDMYAHWFKELFGVVVDPDRRYPSMVLPRVWLVYAKLRALMWQVDKRTNRFNKVFFINACAKTKKRSWSLDCVASLISTIKKQDAWDDWHFIVNVSPDDYDKTVYYFKKNATPSVIVYSARENFFQLPAMISICDVVISVETAVMHLAAAFDRPMVVLMRQKNPEWVPLTKSPCRVVTTEKRKQWVSDIPVDSVYHEVDALLQALAFKRSPE